MSRRHYDAGDYSRGNANWRVLNQSAEFTDRYSRDNVRARARDLERNSDMMNSVIGAYTRNVIGGGYTLQAKTGNDALNDTIEAAWKKWCKKRNCDVTGTQSFHADYADVREAKESGRRYPDCKAVYQGRLPAI